MLGYFFHLITDQLWVAYVVRSYPEIDREVKRDWYGQDFIYVRENPESLFWADFLRSEYRHDYLPQLPRPLISKKLAFIKDTYRRNDEEIQAVFEREYKYFTGEQMNQTLQSIGDQCALIYRLIWLERVDLHGYESALRLLET